MTFYTFIIGLIAALLVIGFLKTSLSSIIGAVVLSAWCMFAPGVNFIYPAQSIMVAFTLVCVFVMADGLGHPRIVNDMTARAMAAPGVIIGVLSITVIPLTWHAVAWYALTFTLMELIAVRMVRTFQDNHDEFGMLAGNDAADMLALKTTRRISIMTLVMALVIMLCKPLLYAPAWNDMMVEIGKLKTRFGK